MAAAVAALPLCPTPCSSSPFPLASPSSNRYYLPFSFPTADSGGNGSASTTCKRRRRGGSSSSVVFFSPPSKRDVTDEPNNLLLPPEDLKYLLKLFGGSVGGAVVVKYGSVLFPEITRPNLLLALLIIATPVAISVLLLLKESGSKTQS